MNSFRCMLKIGHRTIRTEHHFLFDIPLSDKIATIMACANRGGEYTWLEKESNENCRLED